LKCNNLSSEDLANALEQLDIEQSQDKEQINILANGSVGSSVELIRTTALKYIIRLFSWQNKFRK